MSKTNPFNSGLRPVRCAWRDTGISYSGRYRRGGEGSKTRN
jgi:hypothetical protein